MLESVRPGSQASVGEGAIALFSIWNHPILGLSIYRPANLPITGWQRASGIDELQTKLRHRQTASRGSQCCNIALESAPRVPPAVTSRSSEAQDG